MSRSSRRERWRQKREATQQERKRDEAAPPEGVAAASPPSPDSREGDGSKSSEEPRAEVPRSEPIPTIHAVATPLRPIPQPAPRTEEAKSRSTACYIDFENIFFCCTEHSQKPSVLKMVRHLNRLSREASGIGFSHTAVYANYDALITQARHVQDDWAMLGWRTIAVPTREDYMSRRVIKNLVDFIMSMDMLEDARDRGWDHFFIISGDADFCEVAERLKRMRRRVTVVGLKPNLSFRLREAADDYIVWSLDEITGEESVPLMSYRRLAHPSPHANPQQEDPYQVLRRAVRLAEKDQGIAPVAWRVIRDEYFLKMVRMTETEADRFTRELARAGFANLVYRRQRDGSQQAFLSLPH